MKKTLFTLMLTFGLVASAFASDTDCIYNITRNTLGSSLSSSVIPSSSSPVYSFTFSCKDSSGKLNTAILNQDGTKKQLSCSSKPVLKQADTGLFNIQLVSSVRINGVSNDIKTTWRKITGCNASKSYDYLYDPSADLNYMARGSNQTWTLEPCDPKKFPLLCKTK